MNAKRQRRTFTKEFKIEAEWEYCESKEKRSVKYNGTEHILGGEELIYKSISETNRALQISIQACIDFVLSAKQQALDNKRLGWAEDRQGFADQFQTALNCLNGSRLPFQYYTLVPQNIYSVDAE